VQRPLDALKAWWDGIVSRFNTYRVGGIGLSTVLACSFLVGVRAGIDHFVPGTSWFGLVLRESVDTFVDSVIAPLVAAGGLVAYIGRPKGS